MDFKDLPSTSAKIAGAIAIFSFGLFIVAAYAHFGLKYLARAKVRLQPSAAQPSAAQPSAAQPSAEEIEILAGFIIGLHFVSCVVAGSVAINARGRQISVFTTLIMALLQATTLEVLTYTFLAIIFLVAELMFLHVREIIQKRSGAKEEPVALHDVDYEHLSDEEERRKED